MQAYAFPRTSSDRNPIVIVKIFFLQLKVVLRAKRAREGGAIWRVGPDSCKYLRHKKLHISTCRGRYNLGQHVFAYNSHMECRTFKNSLDPWMELNHFAMATPTSTWKFFENILFRTPPWDFVRSAWNLARTLFSWTWSKVIKRILLGQKMRKLLTNKFL